MPIQYSGLTISNTTFTTASGTRREIVDGIAAALLAAGWSQISGAGTGDQILKSATTPQGYAIRIRLYDPGSGNCAQVFLHSPTGALTQTANPAYLLPTAGGTYRVIASAYQFFVLVPTVTTARSFVAAGVPYVPSFLTGTITAVGWMMANSTGDALSAGISTFRTSFYCNGDQAALYNGTLWSGGSVGAGCVQLVPSLGAFTTSACAYNYADDSALITDAMIAFGKTSASATAVVVGNLWDAAIISDSFLLDTTATFDSHNWFNLTSSNTAVPRGSLFVVVP